MNSKQRKQLAIWMAHNKRLGMAYLNDAYWAITKEKASKVKPP